MGFPLDTLFGGGVDGAGPVEDNRVQRTGSTSAKRWGQAVTDAGALWAACFDQPRGHSFGSDRSAGVVLISDVILDDLGPSPGEVLRVVAPMLGRGYAAVAQAVRRGPVLLCSGGSLEVAALVQWLREHGARVTWVPQITGPEGPAPELGDVPHPGG